MSDTIWAAIINGIAIAVAAVISLKKDAKTIRSNTSTDGSIAKHEPISMSFGKYLLKRQSLIVILFLFNMYLIVQDFMKPAALDLISVYSIALKVSTFFSILLLTLIFYIARLLSDNLRR